MPVSVITNVDVENVEEAVAFYSEALGLEFKRWLFDRSVAEMSAGPSLLYLLHAPAKSIAVSGTEIRRVYGPHWTPVHLDVVVDDLETALQRALAAGATSDGKVVHEAPCRFVTIRDPFGHGICLLQFEEGGYDLVESK